MFALEDFTYWEHVYGPKFPLDERTKAMFNLHFDPFEMAKVWRKIGILTKRGKLGYMSSVSPQPMTFGQNKGDFTICVHVLHYQRRKAWKTLHRYKLIHGLMSYKKRPKTQEEKYFYA